MQVILDSFFARPGSAPIWGGKKGDFRDWTRVRSDVCLTKNSPEENGGGSLAGYLQEYISECIKNSIKYH